MVFNRGMRDKISNHLDPSITFTAGMEIEGGAVYDYCCFGVDKAGKLSDDRYMVFYNQTASPQGEIKYQVKNKGVLFDIDLNRLPATIDKLVFTASIDGNGTMGEIRTFSFSIGQGGAEKISIRLTGTDFKAEKAIIAVEIYRKDEWRISAVAHGFNGGLSALLAFYGGTETTAATPEKKDVDNFMDNTVKGAVSIPSSVKASVEEVSKPQKISLAKGQKVSLAKNNGAPIIIENGWTAKGKDYDLKALVRYRNGRLLYIGAANDDELLQTPDGAVRHGGDIKHPGELEHIDIKWHPDIASVAVSSYSALENGTGSFHRYGVYVRIKNGQQVIEISAQNASADDRSYTLCFGEIIFGATAGSFEVSALEMYSAPNSEHRIGYRGDRVVMDIGPEGRSK